MRGSGRESGKEHGVFVAVAGGARERAGDRHRTRPATLNENHLDDLEKKDGRLRRYTIGHEICRGELHSDNVRPGYPP